MRFNGPTVKRQGVVMDVDGKYMNKEMGPTPRRVLCQPLQSKSTYAIPRYNLGKTSFYAISYLYEFLYTIYKHPGKNK